MRCQICKNNEATIHLTEIADGIRSEIHLCENCAYDKGITVKSQMPINELLSSLLSAQPTNEDLFGSGPSKEKKACPYCGITLGQFRDESLLGCPNDYEFFSEELLPVIEKAHDGQTTHCGKVPSGMPQETKKQTELLKLRQQLDWAVKCEDYELAVELRDKIKQLQ